mmetsp:Transcript_15962/g.44167  ORF Transcript_15962/g.44167 Transcript_15962/m.44167 type:complete len:238 (-) Transcript_15962:201-914(-)
MSILQRLVGRDSVGATLQNSNGDTVLHCTCQAQSNSNTNGIVGRNFVDDDDNSHDDDGRDDDKVETMKLFVNSSNVKIGVHGVNNEGNTVLHCTVKDNCLELAQYLMRLEEIDPHVQNKAGDTALKYAQKHFHSDAKMPAFFEPRLDHHPPRKGISEATALIRRRRPKHKRNGSGIEQEKTRRASVRSSHDTPLVPSAVLGLSDSNAACFLDRPATEKRYEDRDTNLHQGMDVMRLR